MSSGSNNRSTDWRRRRFIGGLHTPNYNESDYYMPRFLYDLEIASMDGNRDANYFWGGIDNRATRGHLLAAGFSPEPPSPMPILVHNNGFQRELNPGFLGQGNSQASTVAQEENSRLTQDEQKRVLGKLKKIVYNPTPKRMARRVCLYYRDQARNVANEIEREKSEEGKRCAVCLEDFEPKDLVMLTPCNHMFHEECIVPWVKTQGLCPVCRFSFSERVGGSADTRNTNSAANINVDDRSTGELMSIIRAMEEAYIRTSRS